MLISSLYFIAVLTTAAEFPNPKEFNKLAASDPHFTAKQFQKYKHLPVSAGAFELHTNIFSTSVKINDPITAVASGLLLIDKRWDKVSNTRQANVLNGLGILYRKNEVYEKAISAYQCAMSYAADNQKERVRLLLNMYSSQRKLGLYDDAADSLKQAQHLATDEKDKRRIQQKKATLNLDAGDYQLAQRQFIKLFRDDSLKGTSENAVRSGLNLLDSLILQGKYQQFWRYHNSVKQNIFDLKVENYHYFYHYVIMESVVQAKMLPSQVQFNRVAYALERSTFLYSYGLEESLKKYVKIIDIPWITQHVRPFMQQNTYAHPTKIVPDALLIQLCQN
ncbi:tetratricopeptide repeat protein [Pseudoalteromonas citrea]|uniref:tetratricopeptide repeat protein n=1 Tax=Pseudoalteromonas citrea TaxID=43655 RepID=UPI00110A1A12|nr:tetratricopeptide repeat protein [Pseudoalteromonas citrea]